MTKATYDSIKEDIPLIAREILENQNESQRQIFVEEFSKKRCTSSGAYFSLICLSIHRWYLGKPMLTLLQWILISAGGIGLIWTFIDLFLIPELVKERNSHIAKSILAEQATFNQQFAGFQQSNAQPLPPTLPLETELKTFKSDNNAASPVTASGLQYVGSFFLFVIGFGLAVAGLLGSDQAIINSSKLFGGIGLIISGVLLRPLVQKKLCECTPIKKPLFINILVIAFFLLSAFTISHTEQELINDLQNKSKTEYATSPDKVLTDIQSYAGKRDWKTVQIMTMPLLNSSNPKFKELNEMANKEIALIEVQRQNAENQRRNLEIVQKRQQDENQKFADSLPIKADAVCGMLEGTGLTMGCELNYSKKSIDVKIDTTVREATKICSDTSKMVSSIYAFKGTWSLRILSPFASRPMAVCVLK